MGKWLKRIVLAILIGVFVFSAATVAVVMRQYKISDDLYETAASTFVQTAITVPMPRPSAKPDDEAEEEISWLEAKRIADTAPIAVDFDALRAENPDVIGWIYCEGTVINYPVLQGEDDDMYLHHTYDGAYSVAGSIFVEAENRPGFADNNTIVYGHNMKNGSMFACLEDWAEQEFYDEHREMWLLTPEQDYKLDIVSGYTTSAYSDTYLIYPEPGEEFEQYLETALAKSDFVSDASPDPDGHFVLLSTCAYVFDYARYVLHAELLPASSAGGTPFA